MRRCLRWTRRLQRFLRRVWSTKSIVAGVGDFDVQAILQDLGEEINEMFRWISGLPEIGHFRKMQGNSLLNESGIFSEGHAALKVQPLGCRKISNLHLGVLVSMH
ncbi:hypothetical protein MtrunA17_Chr7g0234341 [Medicago truncatula]|uniref:Uncharacterized protein n=1 Tax=Medicago truncatula TaxID=3880 RepID=A0A396GZ11_MEDTR|nr:hypothetical protein MtrunA17_Chr7g0234341 [Medicago truncatula]